MTSTAPQCTANSIHRSPARRCCPNPAIHPVPQALPYSSQTLKLLSRLCPISVAYLPCFKVILFLVGRRPIHGPVTYHLYRWLGWDVLGIWAWNGLAPYLGSLANLDVTLGCRQQSVMNEVQMQTRKLEWIGAKAP